MNNNKVINRQISINSIIEVAKYLENHKSEYDKQFELEENKNKNIPYGEKNYKYEYGDTSLKYTIEFKNGKNIEESDFNWFVGNLNRPEDINSISLDLYIKFNTKTKIDILFIANPDVEFDENFIIKYTLVPFLFQSHSLFQTLSSLL